MLGPIIWSPSLSVGNDDIDLQHRRLLETANKVMSLSDDQDEAFFAVLDEALQYTFDHFSFEESLLQARGFGRLTQHKSLHDDIRSGAQAMKINWDVVSPKLVKDLMAQIVAHITQADMEYVGHI